MDILDTLREAVRDGRAPDAATRAALARVTDPAVLRQVLDTAKNPCTIGDLDAVFAAATVPLHTGRATIAWLLKYGVLAPAPPEADK